MKRRTFLKAAAAAATAIASAPALAGQAAGAGRPNIILCMTDDQGWADVGYMGQRNRDGHNVKTPVLDEMAAGGLRFDRFYAQSPLCSPTRGSVITGRHPFRYAVWSPGSPIRPQEMSIAQALKSVGYATGHFGKWHLNGVSGPGKPVPGDDPLSPGRFGFDEWFSVSNFFDLDWTFSRKGEEVKVTGDGSDAIVDEALKFIRKAAAEKKPFLALVWYGNPHVPINPLPEYEKIAGSAYAGEIYGIDHSLGTLRAELRKLGIADNTLIWFCSDNGSQQDAGTGGLRGHKSNIWEGGLRVPGIIEWPAKIRRPAVTAVPAVTSDIYPTLLEIVGATAPNQIQPLDGIGLLPLVEGRMTARPKPIGSWHGSGGRKEGGHAALTDNVYKLHKIGGEKFELYDLVKDAAETKDLAAEMPEVTARMKTALDAWEDSVLASCRGEDYPPEVRARMPLNTPAKQPKKGKAAKA